MKKAQSAGIVIIRYERELPKVLFMRSYSYWDFPKGGVEENENKFEAAIREVQEEAGITDLKFKWEEHITKQNHTARQIKQFLTLLLKLLNQKL